MDANLTSSTNYWISQTALQFTLNALGDPDYMIATATAGAVIVCHVPGVDGLGYDDAHNYRRWQLEVGQVYFTTTTKKYVYARIPRTTEYGVKAMLVYPSARIDLYGRYVTADGKVRTDDETGEVLRAEDDEHYYYIELGLISESVEADGTKKSRTWTAQFNFGILNTDEAIAGGLGGWADLIQHNQVNDTMSLLKAVSSMIVSGAGGVVEFLNGSILKLFGVSIKQIAVSTSASDNNSDETLPTTGWISTAFFGKLVGMFIRKDQDDTTTHKLTMGAARVTGDVQVDGESRFGETTDDPLTGKGTLITNDGRVQTTNMQVRGTLSVLDMVASQIHSLDGYYYFSDTHKIAEVRQNTNGTYTVVFEKEYDGDYLKFYVHDILLSIKADLSAASSKQRTQTESGNAMKDITSTSWSRVVATSEEQVVDYTEAAGTYIPESEGAIWAIVQLYNASGNSAPQAGAYIARRGNNEVIADTTSTAYKKAQARKASWCISVEDGRITYYTNQTSNVVGDENIGLALGKLPDIAPIRAIGSVGEIGLYAQTILAEKLMQVKWRGNVKYIVIDEGEWDELRASNGEYKFGSTLQDDRSTVYTQSQVTYEGRTYGCLTNGTSDTPGIDSVNWELVGGSKVIDHYDTWYGITDEPTLEPEGIGSISGDDIEWTKNQDDLFTGTTTAPNYRYSEYYPYMWSYTEVVYSDGTKETTEEAHIIGVFGETGDSISTEMSTPYTTVYTDSDYKVKHTTALACEVEFRIRQGAPMPIKLDSCEILDGYSTSRYTMYLEKDSADNTLLKLHISIAAGITYTNGEADSVKVRVSGTGANGDTISRVVEHRIMPVVQGKDGANGQDAVRFNVDPSTIFVPISDGAVNGGGVTMNVTTIKGAEILSTGQATIQDVNIQMFGYYNWLVAQGVDPYQPQTSFYLQFVQGAECTENAYAIVKIQLLYQGKTSYVTAYVYPFVSGQDVIGTDGISVTATPSGISIPVKNGKIPSSNDATIELVAHQGTEEIFPTITGATISKSGVGSGLSVDYDDEQVVVSWIENTTVTSSAWAEVLVSFRIDDKYYSRALRVPITFINEGDDSITYVLGGTEVIRKSTQNGSVVYTPSSATVSIVRDKGGKPVNITGTNLSQYGSVAWRFVGENSSQTAVGGLTRTVQGDVKLIEVTFSSVEGGTYKKTIAIVNDGEQGIQGNQGFIGCSTRLFVDSLVSGQTYRNDADGVVHDVYWQDMLAVNCKDVESGYIVFRCKKTFTFQNTAGDVDLTDTSTFPTAASIRTYVLGLKDASNNAYFEETAVNYSSAFFTHLVAKDAYIKMLSGSGFYILNDTGAVVGYFGNGDYHIWSGGATAQTAKFWVDKNGNAYLCGKIDATSGTIGGFTIGTNSISGGQNKSLILGDDNMKVEFKAQQSTKTLTVSAGINSYAEGEYSFDYRQNRTTTIPMAASKVGKYNWQNLSVVDLVKMDYHSCVVANGVDDLHHYGFQYAMLGNGHIVMDGIVEGCCLDLVKNFTASNQIQMLQMPMNSNRIGVYNTQYDNCILVLPDLLSVMNTMGYGVAQDKPQYRENYKPFAFKMDFYNLGSKTFYIVGYSTYNFGTSSYIDRRLNSNYPATYVNGVLKNREGLKEIPIASGVHKQVTLIFHPNAYWAFVE